MENKRQFLNATQQENLKNFLLSLPKKTREMTFIKIRRALHAFNLETIPDIATKDYWLEHQWQNTRKMYEEVKHDG